MYQTTTPLRRRRPGLVFSMAYHQGRSYGAPSTSGIDKTHFSPVEGAAAIPLPVAVVGLAVVVLLGEETGGQHAPDAAEHVHRGRIHHVVDLQKTVAERSMAGKLSARPTPLPVQMVHLVIPSVGAFPRNTPNVNQATRTRLYGNERDMHGSRSTQKRTPLGVVSGGCPFDCAAHRVGPEFLEPIAQPGSRVCRDPRKIGVLIPPVAAIPSRLSVPEA